MAFAFTSIVDYGLESAAELLTRGFADYCVKIIASPAILLQMARVDSVDLAVSQVVLRDGVAVGAALMSRRGWSSRLAGMAIVPEGRRQGAGQAVVAHLLSEARTRGERTMVLEVIEQNEPAVRLYETCGFRRVRRLVGYSCAGAPVAGENVAPARLEEVDLRLVAAKVAAHGGPDLPWQISGETVAQLTPPNRGYQLDRAWAATSDVAAAQVTVRALVAESPASHPGSCIALLRALRAQHPGKEWRMSALWPEELAEVFAGAGFTRTALSQWQMERSLAAA